MAEKRQKVPAKTGGSDENDWQGWKILISEEPGPHVEVVPPPGVAAKQAQLKKEALEKMLRIGGSTPHVLYFNAGERVFSSSGFSSSGIVDDKEESYMSIDHLELAARILDNSIKKVVSAHERLQLTIIEFGIS